MIMKLSTKYILFVVLVHMVTITLTWFIFDNKLFFIASEAFIILSLVIAMRLYAELIKPLKYLMQGVEAIKDKDFNVKFLPTGKPELDQLVGVYNQMIDQLRTERTRQEQQHFFLEKLIHTLPTGIVILDHDNRINQLNPKALQILNTHEALVKGLFIYELSQPLFIQISQLEIGQSVVVKPDGVNTYKLQKAHFIDRGFARQFIMIEELTAEILAAEKNVYGKVIRMMAHEVNNTIGPVNSIMQSALTTTRLWDNHQNNNVKDALQVAVDRNQNLNLFMRNFAELVKLPKPNKKPVDLHRVLHNVTGLMMARAKERGIKIEFDMTDKAVTIQADEQLLEQVFINIVKNSMEAIGSDGVIQITLNKKKLIISDTGHGISEENSAKLFTPFFSTKKDGQGIGLTLVREILLSHGFEFSLTTIEWDKTEFMISWYNITT
jgi:two-component system nitrogen regulation sensor histidine kinase NtrY